MSTIPTAPDVPAPSATRDPGELRAFVRAHAENRPGVYRMIGPGDRVLYVGKSIRVRSRLLSYFRADRGEKAAEILGFTERLEWDDHPSEFAALLREFRQIRRLRPPFNVQHKKERAVVFIRIPREPAARIVATTRLVDDGSEYTLQLRDCPARTPLRLADQGDLFGVERVPLCARADFDRCLAPCAAGCTERSYGSRLDVARAFLRGESDEPLERLNVHLRRAIDRWLFEYAAVVQERIEILGGVRDSLLRTERALERLSAVYEKPGHAGDDRVYLLQRGVVRAELPAPRDRLERAELGRRVDQVLGSPPPLPPRIGGDGIAEMLLVERWFRRNPEEQARLTRI
jgi:excinuclease ABC subunit C